MNEFIQFVKDNWQSIVSAVSAFALTCIPLLVTLMKSVKKGKSVKQSLAEVKTLASIQQYCIDCCAEAEGLTEGISQLKVKTIDTSNLKLNTVLTKVNQRCIEMGYGYNEDYWTSYINAYIATTKVVNAK